jgi:hypothetical protein
VKRPSPKRPITSSLIVGKKLNRISHSSKEPVRKAQISSRYRRFSFFAPRVKRAKAGWKCRSTIPHARRELAGPAILCYEEKKCDRAESDLEAALRSVPVNYGMRDYLGLTLAKLGR